MKRSWPLLFMIPLSACSMYSEQFDCTAPKGVGCKPLSQIDALLDRGEEGNFQEEEMSAEPLPIPPSEPHFIPVTFDPSILDPVWRVPEKIMRVWLKGYSDQEDTYYSDTVVYTVVRPGLWSSRS